MVEDAKMNVRVKMNGFGRKNLCSFTIFSNCNYYRKLIHYFLNVWFKKLNSAKCATLEVLW